MISVIIPIYNVEKYLAKCLDSVINQTYKDLEIICVNDESPDNSAQILEEYAQKDNRIKIINRKNGGLSAARNSGLDVAIGDYCYFIDSDDWIELNTIEKLVKIISTNTVDTVVHGANNILENPSLAGTSLDAQVWFDSYIKNNGIYDVPMEIKKYICPVAWNKLYKMDIINKYHCRFPEGLVNEDELFIWTYMIHCNTYYYLNENLYNYLRRSDSIMGTRDKSPKVLDILDIQKEIYLTVKKYKNIEDYKEYLTQNYIDDINRLFQRMPKKYRKEALKRIKLYYENTNHDKAILKLYKNYKYKKLKQFFQGIFSITNLKFDNYVGKQLKLLGLKFKFKNKYKTLLNIIDDKIYACDNQINLLQNQINYANERLEKLYHISKETANTDIIPNKIVFNNMTGKGYGCNPKYIAEEIIRQKLPYELVWLVSDVEKVKAEFPKEIRLVEYNVENSIREFASAKVWISNQRMPQLYENGLFKKKDQFYIQTWHGAALKRIEKDIETEKQWWCKWAKIDSQYMDLLLAINKWDKENLKRNFYYSGEILSTGFPRNDIFSYSEDRINKIKNKVFENLGIGKNKKIALYVPTFRDNGRTDIYDIDFMSIKKVLDKKFNNDFVILSRLHPNISKDVYEMFNFNDTMINANQYSDIQELMLCSDVMITDYSSCMLDFAITKRPIFLYTPDFEQYTQERNFYIDFKELPYPIANNFQELSNVIINFDNDNYLRMVNMFFEKYGYRHEVSVSSQIIEIVKAKVSGQEVK